MTRSLMITIALLGGASTPVLAQTTWPDDNGGNAVSLRATKGFFDQQRPTFSTMTLTPGAQFVVGRGVVLQVEAPIARASLDGFNGESISGTSLGNPYVGVSAGLAPNVNLQAGVRLGIAARPEEAGDNAALAIAIASDFERFEAYSPKLTTLRAVVGIGSIPPHGAFVQGRIGGSMMQPSEGDSELFAEYGVRVGYNSGTVLIHGGVIGRGIVTESEGTVGDRTVNMLAGGISMTAGRLRPSLEFRRLIDEPSDLDLSVSLGLSISY